MKNFDMNNESGIQAWTLWHGYVKTLIVHQMTNRTSLK